MDFNKVRVKEFDGNLPENLSMGKSLKTVESFEVPNSHQRGKSTEFAPYSCHAHNSALKISFTGSSPVLPVFNDNGFRNPPKFKTRYSTSAIPSRANSNMMRGFMNAFPDIVLFSSDDEDVSLVEASKKELNELRKKLSDKDENIKELEEKLMMQKFEGLNECQAVKLEMEQLIADNKVKTENLDDSNKKISNLESALGNAEDTIKILKAREVELQNKMKKMDLNFKRLTEKMHTVEQEKEHEITVKQSFADNLKWEMETLSSKLKIKIVNLQHEKAISDQLRVELANKSIKIEKLAQDSSNLKATMESLQSQLQV